MEAHTVSKGFSAEKFPLKDHVRKIRKRLSLVASIFILSVLVAVYIHFYFPKTYVTSTVLTIETKATDLTPAIGFIKSSRMTEKVSTRSGMTDVGRMISMASVKAAKGARNAVQISVRGRNPEKITEIANAWVQESVRALTEPSIAKKYEISGVGTGEKAKVPERPETWLEKIVLLLGLILGVVLCFVLEHLDHTLRTPNGVKFYAKMRCLADVPPVLRDKKKDLDINKVVHLKPGSLMAETFRNMKVSMIFSLPQENVLQTLMVSSSVFAEGKTFVASNLAITFASSGERVLLVDADMRGGKFDDVYGIKPGTCKGLTGFLSGKAGFGDVVFETSIPNLSIIPSGPHEASPEELLCTDKLEELVLSAKEKFRRVIIDVPSVLNFDDSQSWAKRCDGLLQVIGAGFTPLQNVIETKDKIEGKTEVLGAVLNNVALENDIYYYYRYFRFYMLNNLWQMRHKGR